MLKENFSHVYDKFKLLLYDKAFNDDGDDDALSAFEVICMEIITALKEPTVNAFADAAHMSSPNATYRVNSLIKRQIASTALQLESVNSEELKLNLCEYVSK